MSNQGRFVIENEGSRSSNFHTSWKWWDRTQISVGEEVWFMGLSRNKVEEVFALVSSIPFLIHESKHRKIAEFVSRVNMRGTDSTVILDFEDGEVFLKTRIPMDDDFGLPSVLQLVRSFRKHFEVVPDLIVLLKRLAEGKLSARRAAEEFGCYRL